MSRSLRQFLIMVVVPLGLAGGGTIWLTADLVSRVSTGANNEDHHRTQEVVESALNASRQQLANLVTDNANWDEAALQAYASTVDEGFLATTWGDPTADGVNYDGFLLADTAGHALSAYAKGEKTEIDASQYFAGRLQPLLAKLPQENTASETAASITYTLDGPALVAAATIAPTTEGLQLDSSEARYLVFWKELSPAFIAEIGTKFVINDLKLAPLDSARPGDVLVKDGAGEKLGALQWRDRRPGDLARTAVLPKAYLLLSLLIGVMLAIALFSWRQFRQVAERERQSSRDARRDVLTGLPNRNALNEALAALLDGEEGEACVVFIDLDGFKDVNDTYDHETGDRLIKSVAAGISCLAAGSELVCRIGGDEFVVLLRGGDTVAEARQLAAQIIALLDKPFDIDGKLAAVGASIGIAAARSGSVRPGELMRRADVAMYRAKTDGKNRFCVFDDTMDLQRNEAAAISGELKDILERGAIECAYQPIIDAASMQIVALEALARWPADAARKIGPDRFIPIAETSGLIGRLGDAIIRKACRDALAWPGMRVSVNVSPVQLRNPLFAEETLKVIDSTGIERSRVELEVTEGTLIDDIHRLQPVFDQLHQAGVSIALDDFGSGYSSIAYLRELSFNRIKIDRSLTKALLVSDMARSMIQATGLIANGVSATVTAEGVETGDEIHLLRMAGCTELQGYYFGRPQPAEQISALLRKPSTASQTAAA